MAILSGSETYGGMASDRTPVDKRTNFLLRVAKLAPFARFLDFCPSGKRPVAEKVSWFEDDFFYYQVTNTIEMNSAATTMTVGAANINKIQVGDVLQNPYTREIMLVDSKSTTTIEIVRSLGSTAAGTIAESQVLLIIGNVAGEGQGPPTAKAVESTMLYNYITQLKKSWHLSGRMERLGAEDALGKGKVYAYRRKKKIQEFLRELELMYFFSEFGIDETAADGYRRTFMGGAEEYIRDKTSRTYDLSGGLDTWSEFEGLTESAWDKAEDTDELWLFCSRRYLSKINQFHMGKVTPNKYAANKIGCQVMKIETTDGILNLIREQWFTETTLAGYGFFIDKNCVSKLETIPVKIHDDVQDKDVDERRGYIEWEGTVLFQQADRMLLSHGLPA